MGGALCTAVVCARMRARTRLHISFLSSTHMCVATEDWHRPLTFALPRRTGTGLGGVHSCACVCWRGSCRCACRGQVGASVHPWHGAGTGRWCLPVACKECAVAAQRLSVGTSSLVGSWAAVWVLGGLLSAALWYICTGQVDWQHHMCGNVGGWRAQGDAPPTYAGVWGTANSCPHPMTAQPA